MTGISRRAWLRGSAGIAGLGLLAGQGRRLFAAAGMPPREIAGYGPLAPARDLATDLPLLRLPPGFSYRTFGWANEALAGDYPTPAAHDGMGVVSQQGDSLILIRNHEMVTDTGAFGPRRIQFDRSAGGGTVTLEVDARDATLRRAWPSLSGTLQNCAGGVTPWGTWLSCEEYVAEGVRGGDAQAKFLPGIEREHGFVFEVPPAGVRSPAPLVALGQFRHEAAVVHAASGEVFLTEDRLPFAGFYRCVPTEPGRLSRGGQLQMLRATGQPDLRSGLAIGQTWPVTWADIADPVQGHTPGTRDGLGVLSQGRAGGGSVFTRLEGCIAGADTVWFTSTNGGDAGHGQIFAYHVAEQRLELVYESSGPEAIDYPDNICLSPRGGMVICEDGGRDAQMIWGMAPDGGRFPLAQNSVVLNDGPQGFSGDFRRAEWAGCCFSPDGKWLFANVYKPGFTVAITGPWKTGLV